MASGSSDAGLFECCLRLRRCQPLVNLHSAKECLGRATTPSEPWGGNRAAGQVLTRADMVRPAGGLRDGHQDEHGHDFRRDHHQREG